jgi:acyl-CoA synthetase (AMP-forming)/AMP-acid ligase II
LSYQPREAHDALKTYVARAAELTIGDLFARTGDVHSERMALVGPDASYTFAGLHSRISRLAGGLRQAGIRPDDRVAVLALNCADYIAVFGAIARLGAIFVPLNYRLAPPELEAIVRDSGAQKLLVQPALVEAGRKLATAVGDLGVPIQLGVGTGSLDELVASAPGLAQAEDAGAERNVAALMYTAAVDGTPRGAVMSHRSFVYQAINQTSVIGIRRDDVFAVLTPLCHTAALSYSLSFLSAGATCVVAEKFDPAEAAQMIEERKVTVVFGFAPMLARILDAATSSSADLSSLRLLLGRDNVDVIKSYLEANPTRQWFVGNFGQTETQGMALGGEHVNFGRISAPDFEVPGGRETPLTRVRLVDEDEREVVAGAVGEICVRGPVIADGYWRNSAATDRALRHGWWHTGDLGRVAPDGAVRFVARKDEKELIKTGGENVYPVEVELALRSHPDVVDVCVFGVSDPKWTEAVKAVLVLRPGRTPTVEELTEHLRGRVASYKKPRQFEFVNSLPKGADGLVDRAAVKRRYRA